MFQSGLTTLAANRQQGTSFLQAANSSPRLSQFQDWGKKLQLLN